MKQKKFAFNIKTYIPDLIDEMEAIRCGLFDPLALIAFSRKNLIVLIRSETGHQEKYHKVIPFEQIQDANFLSFASNCKLPFYYFK